MCFPWSLVIFKLFHKVTGRPIRHKFSPSVGIHFTFLSLWNSHPAGWINIRKWQTVDLFWEGERKKKSSTLYFCCHVSLGICCIKAAGNNNGEFEKLIMAKNDVKPLKGPRCACRLDGLNATCSAVSWLIVTTKRLSRFSLNTHLSNRRLITNKAVYIVLMSTQTGALAETPPVGIMMTSEGFSEIILIYSRITFSGIHDHTFMD